MSRRVRPRSTLACMGLLAFGALTAPLAAQLAPANEAGIRIATVHLTVQDPALHRTLWTEMFGAKVVTGHPDMLSLPGVLLVLNQGTPTGGSAGTFIDHIGFLVPNLEAARVHTDAKAFPLVTENAQFRQFTIEFPDAVKVEFTEATDLEVPASLHHIHMFADNAELLRAWYALTLGAEAGMRRQFYAARFPRAPDFPAAEVNFSSGPDRVSNEGRSIDRIGYEVEGLEAFLARLESAGVKIEEPLHEVEGSDVKRAVVLDPLGTRIELTEGVDRH